MFILGGKQTFENCVLTAISQIASRPEQNALTLCSKSFFDFLLIVLSASNDISLTIAAFGQFNICGFMFGFLGLWI